jgi:hypothetical protein
MKLRTRKDSRINLTELSDSQLGRFNRLYKRLRGDVPDVTKEEALRLLNSLEGISQAQAIARLGE